MTAGEFHSHDCGGEFGDKPHQHPARPLDSLLADVARLTADLAAATDALQCACPHSDVRQYGEYYDGGWRTCVLCGFRVRAVYPLGHPSGGGYWGALADQSGRRRL